MRRRTSGCSSSRLLRSSHSSDNYERLEFLGDRVLGYVIARALYQRHTQEPEGYLSRRYNVLVARETCAEVGRELGIPSLVRLGKQARDDRANQSENVIGDVVEALIGALAIDGGLEAAERFTARSWEPLLAEQRKAPKHPKSALQELAAAKECKPPTYEVVGRSGAHHQPKFTIRVTVPRPRRSDRRGNEQAGSGNRSGRSAVETFAMNGARTQAGFVAVIGAPNAGKSTLVNALVGPESRDR